MLWSHLTDKDWADFHKLFPGCWDWLQQRLLLREMEHLERLQARNPWQERRLADLRVLLEAARNGTAQP